MITHAIVVTVAVGIGGFDKFSEFSSVFKNFLYSDTAGLVIAYWKCSQSYFVGCVVVELSTKVVSQVKIISSLSQLYIATPYSR